MNFQTGLPYAADSGLHVIEGLDVGGVPIYQRQGLDRVLPVDMYTLLQGIIERCLATQQLDGSYLVSPVIYNKDMASTDGGISYEPIGKWIERDYPDGVLDEVTGYVDNLMDMYPQNLILQAIDDKLWELGECSSGVYESECFYGWLMETPPYWQAYRDITFVMTAAGVEFDPVSYEMILVPARANNGTAIYGAPVSAARIYPEMLIARYKVMQKMRWTMAAYSDTRIKTSGAVGSSGDYYLGGAQHGLWAEAVTHEEWVAALNLSEDDWKANYDFSLGGVETLNTQAAIDAFFKLKATFIQGWGPSATGGGYSWYIFYYIYGTTAGADWGEDCTTAPHFKTKAYGIPHTIKMWGESATAEIWGFTQANGTPLVAGRNLMWDINALGSEETYSPDIDLRDEVWPPSGGEYPPLWPEAGGVGGLGWGEEVQLYEPINDWEFAFCKHADFGGDVTWHI